MSGFDFELSSRVFTTKQFVFVEMVSFVLCDKSVVVDPFKLQSFPSFLESAICLFSRQHAEDAAQLHPGISFCLTNF